MPELPEVEAVAVSLRPHVVKRRIRSVEVFHPIAVLPQSPAHLSKMLTGHRIESVQRRGKYLFLVLDSGSAIEMHFRFDGHLILFRNAKEVAAQLRRVDRSVALIVSSGYSDAPVMAQFGRYGFDDVLPKPWTPSQLAEVLQRCQRR